MIRRISFVKQCKEVHLYLQQKRREKASEGCKQNRVVVDSYLLQCRPRVWKADDGKELEASGGDVRGKKLIFKRYFVQIKYVSF
jgi:hypothetical protein